MLTPSFKAKFAGILLTDLAPFRSEIDIVKLICNIDWQMGYTFVFDEKEDTLCKIIDAKGWSYENREGARPIIRTKFWWEPSGQFFYLVLTKGISLEQYQKSLAFDDSKGD